MYLLNIQKNQYISRNDIPVFGFEEFAQTVCSEEYRVISMFVFEQLMYAVLTNLEYNQLFLLSTRVVDNYPSLTLKKSCLHAFEREIFENENIEPLGHPFLKPLRVQSDYEFLKSDDVQTHEVAVGPVHAGIIEPGHFRFLCNGERVNHLEIMLGYQKRGVEKLLKFEPSVQLAESICGDSTIAYAKTYCEIMESLSNIEVDEKSKKIRNLALELERLAVHIGDLGALAGDVAYYIGANVFAVTRTLAINLLMDICGNRFGKGLLKLGGVNYDVDVVQIHNFVKIIDEIESRVETMCDAMFANAGVIGRFENTGAINRKKAREIGLVGMAAKASGLAVDSRMLSDNFKAKTVSSGDVFARAKIRYLEIMQSIDLIRDIFKKLSGNISTERHYLNLVPNSFVVGINESWRGEVVHVCLTDSEGNISKYKIKDPSFNNWFGLAVAMRNNQISDFPICNKSFNLSYCGFDL